MGRGKRQQGRGQTRAVASTISTPAVSGPAVHGQPFESVGVAGYDLESTWARKVKVERTMAELIDRFQLVFPQLKERLPVMGEGYAHFANEKARWFYHNRPDELRWEHESASEYVLSPEHQCLVHSRMSGDVHRVWYRYPDGSQYYYEGPAKEEQQLLEIQPSGDVFTADGWHRGRTPDGRPRGVGEDGATDVHRDGTRQWRAALYKKGETLPNDLHPLHREDGPAVVHPDGRAESWRRGKPVPTD